LAKNININ